MVDRSPSRGPESTADAPPVDPGDSFWTEYRGAHRTWINRALHVSGTILSWVLIAVAIVFREWTIAAVAVVSGYGLSWIGHACEGSRPMTTGGPLRALWSDYRMTWLLLTGQGEALELARESAKRADSSGGDDLRPLPLSNFESFMLLDERPSYPMIFFIELQLSGDLRREPLEQSLAETLRLHPLLTSCVRRNSIGRSRWISASAAPRIEWCEFEDEGAAPQADGIDLTQEPGLRIWILHRPASARVICQFHHSATDGIGAIQFFGDWLARYGRLTTPPGEEAPEPGDVAPVRLREREILWPDPRFRKGLLRCSIRRFREMAKKWPRPLASGNPVATPGGDPSPGRPFPPFLTRILDRRGTLQLRTAAMRRGVSVNDICTLAMFRTLAWWNADHGQDSPDDWIRLATPLSLRTPRHDPLPAANSVSFMMLSLRQGELEDTDRSLRYVHHAAEVASSGVEGRLFTYWLGGIAARWPWFFRFASARGCFSTATLANVGNVRRQLRGRFPLRDGRCVAGSVTLESLLGAAPIRQGTAVGTSIGQYAGRLLINMNYDASVFSESEANSLIDRLVLTIREISADTDRSAHGPSGSADSESVATAVPAAVEECTNVD